MISRVDETFRNITNARDVQRFLHEVDLNDKRKGQTYIDNEVANDVPKAIQVLLDNGWKNALKRTTPKEGIQYVTDNIRKLTMEHLIKRRKDAYSYSLVRPRASLETIDNEAEKTSTQVATSSSWWSSDPTGDKWIRSDGKSPLLPCLKTLTKLPLSRFSKAP